MNTLFYRSRANTLLAVLCSALMLQACGGGSGVNSETSNDNPGGVSNYSPSDTQHLGTVSGLGSVVVNGVRFETLAATVQESDDLYGSSKNNKNLALGMTIAIDGETDDSQRVGRARKIRMVGGVRGTVSAYSPNQSLTVGGQTVHINGNTLVVSDSTSSTLQSGDFVNIDGLMQADNSFLATRIHTSSANNFAMDAAWRGLSSNVSTSATETQFTLNTGANQDFTVQCPVDTCSIQPAGASLSGSHSVRVLAESDAKRTGSTIVANKVQVLDAAQLLHWSDSTATGQVKLKGVATLNGSQWLIGGIPVIGTGLNWVVGQFYEVKGTLSNGELTVTSWEAEDNHPSSHRQELYGAISNLQGTRMVVQGVTVDVAQAVFERGSLASMSNGIYVEVKGTMQNNVLVASKVGIKSDSAAGRFEVHGTISNWSSTGFTLTTGNTAYSAIINAQTRIDQEHGAPGNGRSVEVKGYMSGGNLIVLKLEVED